MARLYRSLSVTSSAFSTKARKPCCGADTSSSWMSWSNGFTFSSGTKASTAEFNVGQAWVP